RAAARSAAAGVFRRGWRSGIRCRPCCGPPRRAGAGRSSSLRANAPYWIPWSLVPRDEVGRGLGERIVAQDAAMTEAAGEVQPRTAPGARDACTLPPRHHRVLAVVDEQRARRAFF